MGNHPLEKPPNETDISVNTTSSEGQSKDDSVRLPSLHGNLMRERTHRDPYRYVERRFSVLNMFVVRSLTLVFAYCIKNL